MSHREQGCVCICAGGRTIDGEILKLVVLAQGGGLSSGLLLLFGAGGGGGGGLLGGFGGFGGHGDWKSLCSFLLLALWIYSVGGDWDKGSSRYR